MITNWTTIYHSKRGNVIVNFLHDDELLDNFIYDKDFTWNKVTEGKTSAIYERGDIKGYYDPIWEEIKIGVRVGSSSYKQLYPIIEAVKLAAMTNAEASAFMAQHLKALAPYVGVGGAIAYQLLDHLLGQKSKEFRDWLTQQKRLDEYKQIDIPRYMW